MYNKTVLKYNILMKTMVFILFLFLIDFSFICSYNPYNSYQNYKNEDIDFQKINKKRSLSYLSRQLLSPNQQLNKNEFKQAYNDIIQAFEYTDEQIDNSFDSRSICRLVDIKFLLEYFYDYAYNNLITQKHSLQIENILVKIYGFDESIKEQFLDILRSIFLYRNYSSAINVIHDFLSKKYNIETLKIYLLKREGIQNMINLDLSEVQNINRRLGFEDADTYISIYWCIDCKLKITNNLDATQFKMYNKEEIKGFIKYLENNKLSNDSIKNGVLIADVLYKLFADYYRRVNHLSESP